MSIATARRITVRTAKAHATTLAAMASAILTGLASSEYDPEIAIDEAALERLGILFPPALMVEAAASGFLELNKLTTPRGRIVPVPEGGEVPLTNSRVMPDGSLRDYDPKIDG